jgi:hypothetical protein
MGRKKGWLERLKRIFRRDEPPQRERPPITIPQVIISRSRERGVEATFEVEGEDDGEETAVDPVALRQQMLNHLEMKQLQQICADLGIDFDALAGGKGRKVMAIVQRAGAENKLDALAAACARHNE